MQLSINKSLTHSIIEWCSNADIITCGRNSLPLSINFFLYARTHALMIKQLLSVAPLVNITVCVDELTLQC